MTWVLRGLLVLLVLLLALIAGYCVGGVLYAQYPTIVIPAGWQGYVCAEVPGAQAQCKTADQVRGYLSQR